MLAGTSRGLSLRHYFCLGQQPPSKPVTAAVGPCRAHARQPDVAAGPIPRPGKDLQAVSVVAPMLAGGPMLVVAPMLAVVPMLGDPPLAAGMRELGARAVGRAPPSGGGAEAGGGGGGVGHGDEDRSWVDAITPETAAGFMFPKGAPSLAHCKGVG